MAAAWTEEREAAVQAARAAGAVLLEWRHRFTVELKRRRDPVTEADRNAQEVIFERLHKRFPGDGFLGEEGLAHHGTNDRLWIVDPLDGTVNYVHDFPLYCVSIGLEAAGELVLGVIHDPVRDQTYVGVPGQGVSRDGQPVQVSDVDTVERSLLCAGLPAHVTVEDPVLRTFVRLSASSMSIRRLGSAALGLAYVATGQLDGFWSRSLMPWDTAAGVALIAAAGGTTTNFDGSRYDVHSPDIVSSNGRLHAGLLAAVADIDVDAVD